RRVLAATVVPGADLGCGGHARLSSRNDSAAGHPFARGRARPSRRMAGRRGRSRAVALDRPVLAGVARSSAGNTRSDVASVRALGRRAVAPRRSERQPLPARRAGPARGLEPRLRRQSAHRPGRLAAEPAARRRPGALGARSGQPRSRGAARGFLRLPCRTAAAGDGADSSGVPAAPGDGRAGVGGARARPYYTLRVIRKAGPQDVRFLRDMLKHAYHWRLNTDPDLPVARYVNNWGRPGDRGLIAWENGPVGAAWYRLFPER